MTPVEDTTVLEWAAVVVGVVGLLLLIIGIQDWWRKRQIPGPLMVNSDSPEKGWFVEHFDLRRDR